MNLEGKASWREQVEKQHFQLMGNVTLSKFGETIIR